jgi:hypothetical protein
MRLEIARGRLKPVHADRRDLPMRIRTLLVVVEALGVAACSAASAPPAPTASAIEALADGGATCTTVTVAASPSSPQAVGASVSFTASADCGGSRPEYEFRLSLAGGKAVVEQAYSKASSWTWDTSGATPGDYSIEVSAHAHGATGDQAERVVSDRLRAHCAACTPTTCGDLGYNCGQAGDGCGGLLSCGSCSAPKYCGGGGPGLCGGSSTGDGGCCVDAGAACTPLTCTQQGFNCGTAGDGCGGVIDCGSCPEGQVCGSGGKANRCGC